MNSNSVPPGTTPTRSAGQGASRRPLWRHPLCWLKLCGHRTAEDDDGIWGECVTCHSRAGYVSRDQLRAFADREVIRERIRRGEPVSMSDALAAIGATPDDILSIHIPARTTGATGQ